MNREVLRGMAQDVLLFPGVCACFPRYATLTVAAAEDAAEQVVVDYQELDPVTGMTGWMAVRQCQRRQVLPFDRQAQDKIAERFPM